ncbi:MAG: hypothetical protein FOGNACKC_03891 [Anaerolineae bacterium]|nr:hypothetical protein [Anaerolineae bacterium]
MARVDSNRLAIGNAKMMAREGTAVAEVQPEVSRLSGEGKTVTYVAADGKLAGLIALADNPKATSGETVRAGHALGLQAYNIITIPIAAGILYSSLRILLRPEWAALAMAASTITVTINALALKWAGLPHAETAVVAPQTPVPVAMA